MQRIFLAALLLVAFAAAASYTSIMHGKRKQPFEKQAGNGTGFAVVELFTSEGCSSCPPADEALAQLLTAGKKNVYVLGFHVDYWNSLGWKDVYSNAAYSARQQGYGRVFRLNSVYTPQAVVNGGVEFTGSDASRLNDVVEKYLNQPVGNTIEIAAKKGPGNTVGVTCTLQNLTRSGTLNVALVQLHAVSRVQRGENQGRVLNHVNVVRDFKTISIGDATGVITLQIPDGLTANDCKIIAFTQDAGFKTTSAAETSIY